MGDNVLIGVAHGDFETGTGADVVYLFDGSTGDLLRTFNNPTNSNDYYFGFNVAAVGNNILVGSFKFYASPPPYLAAAYLFEGYPEPNGVVENLNSGQIYNYIQDAINNATAGDELVASKGTYYGYIDFKGKNLTVRSINPNDPAVVASTVISGSNGTVVTFANNEDSSCVLSGFTITGGNTGIYCEDASPTIANCIIKDNSGIGVELDGVIRSIFSNCLITANSEDGVVGGFPTINNCTITGNGQYGLGQGQPRIFNSIIWGNVAGQIYNDRRPATYSNIQGGWDGVGNIDVDPCFVDPLAGDYHLQSVAGRWDPNTDSWVTDTNTSACIDTGNPGCSLGDEPIDTNNVRINMGAYGGTSTASKSPPGWQSIADLNNDWVVNHNDLALFGNYWLAAAPCLSSDLNRNEYTDFYDFAFFANEWLWEE